VLKGTEDRATRVFKIDCTQMGISQSEQGRATRRVESTGHVGLIVMREIKGDIEAHDGLGKLRMTWKTVIEGRCVFSTEGLNPPTAKVQMVLS
jgi:hypothetical protein